MIPPSPLIRSPRLGTSKVCPCPLVCRAYCSTIRDLDCRKVLPLLPELDFRKVLPLPAELDFRKALPLLPQPELLQPVVRAVTAQLRFVRWIVLAVVPAAALEPVSPHFRQSWHALLLRNQKLNNVTIPPKLPHSLFAACHSNAFFLRRRGRSVETK